MRTSSSPDRHHSRRHLFQFALLGPAGHPAFAPLTPKIVQPRVLLAYMQHAFRDWSQRYVGLPLDRMLFDVWMRNKPGADYIVARGLPRRALETALGKEALTLDINPRELIRTDVRNGGGTEKPPSSLFFLWDGNWDLRRQDLRVGRRYRLIADIDENRDDLTRTERYQEHLAALKSGHPWRSHQAGILLDTPDKIYRYLQVYLAFLDSMASVGYVPERCRDEIGVAVSRDGRILKINRGLHRLAMAQRVGLPTIPVRVRAVHRLWWQRVVGDGRGEAALARVRSALRDCVPEQEPGPLDSQPQPILPEEFWPPARWRSSLSPA
ncbi:hypothetical protein EKL30_14430 [Candidimonas sp. SYP-B2681]|uniref:hypothetical protein n=1 Tax=Candidimonas sp. SYP-B2681 TaxID=2497686 RepID=UPI000F899C48|nr:hypothetical protein [Candidimonas sp. SYP-B2681]RTZ41745.1 hypothetical protein EKL30_14430 [Candidimonas sp. SYP-B2681]